VNIGPNPETLWRRSRLSGRTLDGQAKDAYEVVVSRPMLARRSGLCSRRCSSELLAHKGDNQLVRVLSRSVRVVRTGRSPTRSLGRVSPAARRWCPRHCGRAENGQLGFIDGHSAPQ
jgi:hypothetical protein